MEGALTHLPQMLLLSYFISSNSNQAFFFYLAHLQKTPVLKFDQLNFSCLNTETHFDE